MSQVSLQLSGLLATSRSSTSLRKRFQPTWTPTRTPTNGTSGCWPVCPSASRAARMLRSRKSWSWTLDCAEIGQVEPGRNLGRPKLLASARRQELAKLIFGILPTTAALNLLQANRRTRRIRTPTLTSTGSGSSRRRAPRLPDPLRVPPDGMELPCTQHGCLQTLQGNTRTGLVSTSGGNDCFVTRSSFPLLLWITNSSELFPWPCQRTARSV
mmetsp:Transcript_37583/g.67974  ORF Transcript_37583/g.67974 Transcript_37583/m.67974 type:complete len:213 (+) Transcript_37583:717-1355(+)